MKTIYFIILVLLIVLNVRVEQDEYDGCYELHAAGTHFNNTCFDSKRG